MRVILEVIVALSLSNLLFMRDWKRLLWPTTELYHVKLTPYPAEFAALLLNVLLAAFVFLAGLWSVRYLAADKGVLVAKLVFLAVAAISANGLRQLVGETFPGSYLPATIVLALLILVVVVVSVFQKTDYFVPAARLYCLILSPLVLVSIVCAFISFLPGHSDGETPIRNQLSAIRGRPKPKIKSRVVWIIFDELDYSIPFEKNISGLKLPEFERLRNESFFATKAIPPAYTTRNATASLLTGRIVKDSTVINDSDLKLEFSDAVSGDSTLRSSPSVFHKVRQLGSESAVVGWLHPYCRVWGEELSACTWQSVDSFNDVVSPGIASLMTQAARRVLLSVPFGTRIDGAFGKHGTDIGYIERHQKMLDSAVEVISDPNIDLSFVHLPFPHPPHYYNPDSGEFDPASQRSYIDNLILTDRVLGKLRRALEEKDLWNKTTLIVSSDHQLRVNVYKSELTPDVLTTTEGKEDPRVPFFLKLPNQGTPTVSDLEFNTVITSQLIIGILNGTILTTEDLVNSIRESNK
jgi:uncharacterized membrane protein YiaA